MKTGKTVKTEKTEKTGKTIWDPVGKEFGFLCNTPTCGVSPEGDEMGS